MTLGELLFLPQRQLLLSAHFLLLAAQMALLLTCVRENRSLPVRCASLLHFSVGFVLLWLMITIVNPRSAGPDGTPAYHVLFPSFGSLPARAMAAYEVFTAVVLLVALIDLIRYRRSRPTSRSVKQTMDLLPAGIAFIGRGGDVALRNVTMDELWRATGGVPLVAPRDSGGGAPGGTGGQAPSGEATDQAPAQLGVRTIRVPGIGGQDAVWQVTTRVVDVEGESFTQVTASDVTQQARLTEELAQHNEKLRDIRLRLDIYNKQAERMTIAQELLTARMAVHNELGNVLLEGRHFLNDPASFDERMLLRALRHTNTFLLREYEQDDAAGDALADALELAAAIGVEVTIAGVAPTTEPWRGVLAAAITECATNTVKHADGSALTVAIRQTDGGRSVYTLTGDGRRPHGEVRESGGLASLRSLVQREGGTMRIDAAPRLTVTITMPPE